MLEKEKNTQGRDASRKWDVKKVINHLKSLKEEKERMEIYIYIREIQKTEGGGQGEIRGVEKCEQQGRGEEKLEKWRMW